MATKQNQTSPVTTSNAVAQNDKQQERVELKALIAERKAWEEGAYRTSNQQLYAVLAKCLSYYNELSAVSKKEEPRMSFDAFAEANGIRFKGDTPLIHKVVKCVFFEPSLDRNAQRDRRRISAYALVLRRALADKITVAELPSWIEDNGGIEQIRLGKSNELSPTVKAQAARESVEGSDKYIAVVENDKLREQFNAEDYDSVCVALIIPRKDGKVEIQQVVKASGAVNASLASVFSKAVSEDDKMKLNKQKQPVHA